MRVRTQKEMKKKKMGRRSRRGLGTEGLGEFLLKVLGLLCNAWKRSRRSERFLLVLFLFFLFVLLLFLLGGLSRRARKNGSRWPASTKASGRRRTTSNARGDPAHRGHSRGGGEGGRRRGRRRRGEN